MKITVDGDNEDKVRERLERINVEFSNSSSLVSAKTVIDKISSGWFNNNKVNFKIDYKVKVPITNKHRFEQRLW